MEAAHTDTTGAAGTPDPAATSQAPAHAATARLTVHSPQEMQELGRALARLLRPGDLVMLTGELGAGKTTLTRGLGEGLGVRGAVTSPTFVIARVHPSLDAGPPLVHVDAYRLGSFAEVEDLDLEASLEEAVTVVEWGEGKAEGLAPDRLEVVLRRARGGESRPASGGGADARSVTVRPVGTRWHGTDLAAALLGRPDLWPG